MAGHNKWSKIKRKKASNDAQRGKIFSKIVKELIVAAKMGGPDPSLNARLRLAIQKAKEANMPNENLKRAIKKGAGGDESVNYEEVTFEAYGPYGVAILIETLTDNKNRTVPNIRNALSKHNGSLGTKGSVSYLFDQTGMILFDAVDDEDAVVGLAIDAGAEDVDVKADGSVEILTDVTTFETVKKAFDDAELAYASAQLTFLPQTEVTLDKAQAQTILNLVEKLEDDDDVQQVYTNSDIPDDLFNELDV